MGFFMEKLPLLETFQYFLFLFCVVFAAFCLALFIRSRLMKKSMLVQKKFSILMFVMVASGIILALKLSPADIRPHLLTLLGIVVSATIALSATTFISNAMAGMMLQGIRNFKLGDFIKVENYLGRVSKIGFLHIDIQTEERCIITLPNLFLATHPVSVISSSDGVISANVSLGYNVPSSKAEKALGEAALEAGLKDPFIQILELGDYSVKYRCAGFLENTKVYFTAQSVLRAKMLERLHKHGIEIVSPKFVNQRIFSPLTTFMPNSFDPLESRLAGVELGVPENLVFDAAEKAALLGELQDKQKGVYSEIISLREKLNEEKDPAGKNSIVEEIKNKQFQVEALAMKIQNAKKAQSPS